jgi:hypothetical protein
MDGLSGSRPGGEEDEFVILEFVAERPVSALLQEAQNQRQEIKGQRKEKMMGLRVPKQALSSL